MALSSSAEALERMVSPTSTVALYVVAMAAASAESLPPTSATRRPRRPGRPRGRGAASHQATVLRDAITATGRSTVS